MICVFLLFFMNFVSGFREQHNEKNPFAVVAEKFLEEKRKEGLVVCGSGGSMPDGKITEVFFDFEIHKRVDVDEARKIVVKTVEDFLKQVNENAALKKELAESPMTYKHINFIFAFYDENNKYVLSPYVSCAFCYLGEVRYVFQEPENYLSPNAKKIREPYPEALQKSGIKTTP